MVTSHYKVSSHSFEFFWGRFDPFTPGGEGLSESHVGERWSNGRFVGFIEVDFTTVSNFKVSCSKLQIHIRFISTTAALTLSFILLINKVTLKQ